MRNFLYQSAIFNHALLRFTSVFQNGWLGLIMGARLWIGFADADHLTDEAVFEQRVDSICRELGDRGRLDVVRI